MFNLNIPASSLLSIDGTGLCSTPKTPEIVNSLIAMTNPLDNYNFSAANNNNNCSYTSSNGRTLNSSGQSASQDSSHSSCSASPLDSPAGCNSTTPSVQQTCSQLIKAGLKLSIQSKRKLSTCDSSSGSEQPNSKCARRDEDLDLDSSDDDCESKSMPKGLTPEDEDRRRRRRERNKIAATKCRMKKRERTQNLIKESEILDNQNVELKSQVRTLEAERRKLIEMLQAHAPSCRRGFTLPMKFHHSPAQKYLADLQMDESTTATNCNSNGAQASATSANANNCNNSNNNGANTPQRTAIPPMSTIKFSRSNNFKAAAAAVTQQQQQQHQILANASPMLPATSQLPNGYCKPSPTSQELGYLNSPSQDNICLPSLQTHAAQASPTATNNQATLTIISHQLSDYIPSCDNSLGYVHTPAVTPNGGGDNSILLGGGIPSPLTCISSTPTTATEFVKNELVDSQSPYTTAQSAERFLFENNCDNFVDIKHAVSVIPSNNNNNSIVSLAQSNNNNLLDFHTTLLGSAMGCGGGGIVPFHDQLSIKNDYLHDADLLALTGDAEFVDLDTGVAAAFMTNGGCLA